MTDAKTNEYLGFEGHLTERYRSFKSWLADHDAALAQAVREQCLDAFHDAYVGILMEGGNHVQAKKAGEAAARALPLPDADRHDERIRLEARRDETKLQHESWESLAKVGRHNYGEMPELCVICKRGAALEAALEKLNERSDPAAQS